jgi:hypothetical protein
MIRRVVNRVRLVAPPGWSVLLGLVLFTAFEGPVLYVERQLGRVLDLPIRPGRLLLITGAVLLGANRVRRFHPYFQPDYLRWLKSTPWTVRKPLPAGSVELGLEDLPALGGLILLSAIQPQTRSIELIDAFLFSHTAVLVATFWRTGVARFGYCAALFLGFVPQLWGRPWLDLAVLGAIYLFVHEGLWKALARFPWPTEGAAADMRAEALEERHGPLCGWPYDRLLRDVRTANWIGRTDALLISMLLGWWSYSLDSWFPQLVSPPAVLSGSMGPLVVSRFLLYRRGYAPPISLAGRLATFRWIIPGYDQIFLGPVLVVLGMALAVALGAWSGLGPRVSSAMAVSFLVLLALTSPPTWRRWRLTGHHRIVNSSAVQNPQSNFVKVG